MLKKIDFDPGRLSRFGEKFTRDSGISSLMDDLGAALVSRAQVCMLGGGNPARIPAVQQKFRESMQRMLDKGDDFERVIGNYDSPQGDAAFLEALAGLLKREFNWNIGAENVAVTNGSQSGFFTLFNMFAGQHADGRRRKIMLPITPEYIGYSDVGVDEPLFDAHPATIEKLDDHTFKYRVNFDDLRVDDGIAAICVSRPTNPTGNVLTDREVDKLMGLAAGQHIPLIIDGAYGTPFPNIIFSDVQPVWNENIIFCMSLSKLGLPGVRTGIIIADAAVIRLISRITAILNLAVGSFGPALTLDLIKTGEVIHMSRELIRPYYLSRAQRAVEWFHRSMGAYPFLIHKPEGAIFLWLWFPQLPITSQELYTRLKARGVLVIAGHHFFPGLRDEARHRHECIRVTYSQNPAAVEKGIGIIAEEVRRAYDDV